MEPNALEIIEKRIVEGKEKVPKEEIEEAFVKAKTSIENRISIFGEKVVPTPEELAKLSALKERMLQEVDALKTTYDKAKEGLSSAADSLRKVFGIDLTSERHQKFDQARSVLLAKTDPNAPGAAIEDYEGVGEANSNNRTRGTLMGYLLPMYMDNPNMSEAEFMKAKEIYDKSDTLTHFLDKSLDYKHLMEDMGMQKYMDEIAPFEFASESAGFAAGNLKIVDTAYPAEKVAYRQYFFSTLNRLKAEGKFISTDAEHPYPEGLEDIARGGFELQVLQTMLVSPKEFAEKFSPAKERFTKLQSAGNTLSSSLHITFKDPVTVAFLAKKAEQFTQDDASNLDDVSNRMKTEALSSFALNVSTARSKNSEINAALSRLEADAAGKLDEKELADLHLLITNNDQALAGMNANPTVPFEELVNNGSKLESLQQHVTLAEISLQNLQKKATEAPAKKTNGKGKKNPHEKPSKKPGSKRTPKKSTEENDAFETTLPDDYEKDWELGVPVESRFTRAEVQVSPNLKNTPIRSDKGKIIGRVGGLQELSIAHMGEMAKKVNDTVFVKVSYKRGRREISGWVDESVLRYSDRVADKQPELSRSPEQDRLSALEEDRAPLSRFKTPGVSVEIPKELGYLGNVYAEYVEALTKLDAYARNMERYPDGLSFNLRINTDDIPCRMTYDPKGFNFTYGSKSMRYGKMEDFMRELNSGELHQKITYELITNKDSYKSCEARIGSVNSIEKKPKNSAEMELEWNGQNPEVNFEVLPHGRINYSVVRDNVGFYGKDVRSGIADNAKDWITLLAHDRKWAEGPQHKNGENSTSSKEIVFSAIANPFSYRNDTFQKEAGRVIGFKLLPNEVATMYLDWGDGNAMDAKINPLLKVGVGNDGKPWFSMYGKGIGTEGSIAPETVKDFATMMARVKEVRGQVSGNVVVENRSSVEKGREGIDAFLREKNLVEMNDGSSYSYVSNMQFSVMNGKAQFDYGNAVSSFEKKAARTLKGIFDKIVDQKDLVDVKNIIEKADKMDSKAMRRAVLDALHSFLTKVSDRLDDADIKKLRGVMDLMGQTLYKASITFPSRPTLDELKRRYEQDAIPAWKKAEEKLDGLMRS